jgi:hypothetical protein
MTVTTEAYSFLNTAKYFCTLSLMEYKRPKPFDPGTYKAKKIIRLPLPLELRDDTAVSYNNIDLKVVGDVANKDFSGGLGAEGLRQAGTALSALPQAIAGGLTNAGGNAGNAGIGLGAMAVGKGLDNAIDPEAITSAIQQAAGVAPNPNPSVAFQGPSLREMSYTWTFMPTNAKDSARIRAIINQLKAAALPRANSSGESAAILDYPFLCQMNFFPWDNNGTGAYGWSKNSIIKMKRCFMASVNVNYTAGAAPSFFAGWNNEPTIIQLSINFKEIEYFMAHDYGDKVDSKGFSGGAIEIVKGIFGVDYVETPPDDNAQDPTTDATAGADGTQQ